MFSKLKDKLKDWTKKIIEDKEEEVIEIKEEKKSKKNKDNKKNKKKDKKIKSVNTKNTKKESKEKIKKQLEEKLEQMQEEIEIKKSEEKKEEKKSFFKKIFSGTIKTSEEEKPIETEKIEEIKEEPIKEKKPVEEKVEETIQETQKKKSFLKEILKEILIEPFNIVEKIKEKSKRGEPYVILFCGINGTGKTTTIAKIAHMLKQEKLSCVIAAADTFRAAAIDQIKTHGERLDTKVIAHEYGSDPASVGFDAIKYAKKNNIPCVLIDTAGRIHTATNLLREMEKIVKVCKPDTKIFVGESITGNDAIEQVKSFNDIIGIDGIILSKADIDEKGGTALSLGYTTKKPILYLGIGQEYNQIELFDKNKFLEKLGL